MWLVLLEDEDVTSLSVSTALWVSDTCTRRWIIREVLSRVDFIVDGRRLADLLSAETLDPHEGLVTMFDNDRNYALDLLSGKDRDESYRDPARVPILECACGDLLCGALTVKLAVGTKEVVWSEWAWDDEVQPQRKLPALPVCRFDADEYADALRTAFNILDARQMPVSRMRVRRPNSWWQNLRGLSEDRTNTKLSWLHADAVHPTIGEADDDYCDFLIDLYTAQTMLTGEASGGPRLGGESRTEVVEALKAVSRSPHRISLPPQTLEAIKWYLDHLQR